MSNKVRIKKTIVRKKSYTGAANEFDLRLRAMEAKFDGLVQEISEVVTELNQNMQLIAQSIDSADLKALAALKALSFYCYELEHVKALSHYTGFGPDHTIMALHAFDPESKETVIKEPEFVEELKKRATNRANGVLRIAFDTIKAEREKLAKEKAEENEKATAEAALKEAESRLAVTDSETKPEEIPEGAQVFGG